MILPDIEMTKQGAAFVSKSRKLNPRAVILALIERFPTLDRKELFQKFYAQIDNDEDYKSAVYWYYFINMHDYFTTSRSMQKGTSLAEDIRKEKIKLMQLLLPMGKKLAQATFGECAKCSGWLRSISKLGPATAIVGETLTEKQLLKAWKRFAGRK